MTSHRLYILPKSKITPIISRSLSRHFLERNFKNICSRNLICFSKGKQENPICSFLTLRQQHFWTLLFPNMCLSNVCWFFPVSFLPFPFSPKNISYSFSSIRVLISRLEYLMQRRRSQEHLFLQCSHRLRVDNGFWNVISIKIDSAFILWIFRCVYRVFVISFQLLHSCYDFFWKRRRWMILQIHNSFLTNFRMLFMFKSLVVSNLILNEFRFISRMESWSIIEISCPVFMSSGVSPGPVWSGKVSSSPSSPVQYSSVQLSPIPQPPHPRFLSSTTEGEGVVSMHVHDQKMGVSGAIQSRTIPCVRLD